MNKVKVIFVGIVVTLFMIPMTIGAAMIYSHKTHVEKKV